MRPVQAVLSFMIAVMVASALSAQVTSQAIQSPELEEFLREAEIVEAKGLSIGITAPKKLTLSRDGVTRYGVFKSIDEYKPLLRFEDGRVDSNFQDSWKSEIAAYEIDKIIGLGMVPVTVERTYRGERGSVQLWVESMMSEGERRQQKRSSPDTGDWNSRMYKARLFDNLVYNTDRNLQNLLITSTWEIILIDHSRAFRPFNFLKSPRDLERFSLTVLEGLKRLNKENLTEKAGKYLPEPQINGILKRRDEILELAKKTAAQKSEAVVYYP